MVIEIIGALIVGLIAGFIAKAIVPGDEGLGIVPTILLGLGGALVGWLLFTYLLGIGDTDKFDLGSIIGSIIGAVLLILVYKAVKGKGRGRSRV